MNFYWFDAFVLGFTLLLGLKGIINGLIKEVFGLLGIVGGVFIASKYANEAALFIQNTFYKIQNESLASFVGFLAILLLFWILCLLVGNLFAKIIKLSGLSFLDRLGGFLFGGTKVFLIFAILVFCVSKISFLNEKLENFAKDSYTLASLKKSGAYIMNQNETNLQDLQEEVKENLKENLENLQELNPGSNGTQEKL